MPRLVKGGKWVYGWIVVSEERAIRIPAEALAEYGFRAGDEILVLRGSQRSGGFGLSTPERIGNAFGELDGSRRLLGRARLAQDGWLSLPSIVAASPGDRLLAVRGSGLALGFVVQGPIYEQALGHPELTGSG